MYSTLAQIGHSSCSGAKGALQLGHTSCSACSTGWPVRWLSRRSTNCSSTRIACRFWPRVKRHAARRPWSSNSSRWPTPAWSWCVRRNPGRKDQLFQSVSPGERASKRFSVTTIMPFVKRNRASRSTSTLLKTFSPGESLLSTSASQASATGAGSEVRGIVVAGTLVSVVIVKHTPARGQALQGGIWGMGQTPDQCLCTARWRGRCTSGNFLYCIEWMPAGKE